MSGRSERFRCPECGHVVVATVGSRTGDWLLNIDCDECGEGMVAGIFAYGGGAERGRDE